MNSSRGGGGRHLGGGAKILHTQGEGVQNKEHFKRRSIDFLLKSWSGDQNIYLNLRWGMKVPSNI